MANVHFSWRVAPEDVARATLTRKTGENGEIYYWFGVWRRNPSAATGFSRAGGKRLDVIPDGGLFVRFSAPSHNGGAGSGSSGGNWSSNDDVDEIFNLHPNASGTIWSFVPAAAPVHVPAPVPAPVPAAAPVHAPSPAPVGVTHEAFEQAYARVASWCSNLSSRSVDELREFLVACQVLYNSGWINNLHLNNVRDLAQRLIAERT